MRVIDGGELWLLGSHISPLLTASTHIRPDPTRTRKLLLKAEEIRRLSPALLVETCPDLDALAARLPALTQADDLVLAMGAGDVNGLWGRLGQCQESTTLPLAA